MQEIRTYGELRNILDQRGKMVLFGCGGHARSIIGAIREICSETELILVDPNVKTDEIILGCNTEREYGLNGNDGYIVAVGCNDKRGKLYGLLKEPGSGQPISVVSQYAHIGMEAEIGRGTFVSANAYVAPQAKVGYNSIINTGSVVEHEVKIGNHTHIAPHTTVCGRAEIGNHVFCGAGSIVIDKIRICDHVIIGAGAVVKEDITEPGTYVGVPARKIKEING